MKNSSIALALGAALCATAGVAHAGSGYDPALDISYNLGGFNLDSAANGGVTVAEFLVTPPANDSMIVGISFSGTVAGISGTGSWASDLMMVVTDPMQGQVSVGGFSGVQNNWDFQGSGSSNDGFYESGPHLFWADSPIGKDGAGSWKFTFTNDWDSTFAATMSWTDVTITFHKLMVPAPGALALLGLAGLAGGSRRRRA